MDLQQLKTLLRNNKLKPNFTYGQNFLVDDIVLEDITDAADVQKDDVVLEIGPGIGNLTRRLCERAKFVLSIEKDPKFVTLLKSIKKDYRDNFRFEISDILDFNFQEALQDHGAPYKVVANIPYFITGKILQLFLQATHKPQSITMLVQKEIAENITAKPGSLSVLAISVQLFGQATILRKVPAESFYPAPKVESAIIKITPYKKPVYTIADQKKLFRLLKACFSGKRKQLHNSLTNNLRLPKSQVLEALKQLDISPTIRPQELSIDQWILLCNLLLGDTN